MSRVLISEFTTSHKIKHNINKSDHDYILTLQHPCYGEIGGCTIQPIDALLRSELGNIFNLAVQYKEGWFVNDLYFDLDEEIMDKLSDPELKMLMLDFYHSLYTVLEHTSQTYTIPYYCFITQTNQYLGAKQLGLLPLDHAQRIIEGQDNITVSFLNMAAQNSQIFYQHQQLERQSQQLASSLVH